MSVALDAGRSVLAIIAVALIALVSIEKALDGQLILACVVVIAGLGGYDAYTAFKRAEAAAKAENP